MELEMKQTYIKILGIEYPISVTGPDPDNVLFKPVFSFYYRIGIKLIIV